MSSLERRDADRRVEELLDKLQPRLRQIFARYHVPVEDAEDLLQQALLSFLYKGEDIQDPETWLPGAIRNRCLMYWRTRRRRIYTAVDSAILESVADREASAQELGDLRRDLSAAIGRLNPRCQSLIRLRYGLGCGAPETARRLGYRPSGIYKVMERCLSALTSQLVESGLVEKRRSSR